MGDDNSTSTGKKSGIIKTIIGAGAGLFSGAFVMYLSPLVDNYVKPSKPVANFAVDYQGTTVLFHNRSTGGADGWWDFGDGSPLEPLSLPQDIVTHSYEKPGTFMAKLTIRNRLREESERSINLQLEGIRTERPSIETLDAIPISPGSYAPATFRLVSSAKNAKVAVWDFGDDGNLDINTETPNTQEKLVTYKEPGSYMIKLAAFNGEEHVQKSTIVAVDVPPADTVTAILSVADQGTRLDTIDTTTAVSASFPPDSKDSTYRFERQVPAKQGYEIVVGKMDTVNDKAARGLNLTVASDRKSIKLTGELVKDGGMLKKNGTPPPVVVRVVLKQERRGAENRSAVQVTGTLNAPGSTLLMLPPLPANWVDPQRKMRLELREGDRVVMREGQLPRGQQVTVQGKKMAVVATPVGNQVRVELTEPKAGIKPSTN